MYGRQALLSLRLVPERRNQPPSGGAVLWGGFCFDHSGGFSAGCRSVSLTNYERCVSSVKFQKVRKAVIPAAGLGTRVLPITKALPKEMLPIVDKPAIQYIVEEAVQAGIEDILIITNRGKGVIEDHFDHAFELETNLKDNASKQHIYEELKAIANLANVYFIRQKETKGLADAILRAKSFVGNEPFGILYGDDVIVSEDPVIGQLCRAYEEFGFGAVGVKEVPREDVPKYCTLDVTPLRDNIMKCNHRKAHAGSDSILLFDPRPCCHAAGDFRHHRADPGRQKERRGLFHGFYGHTCEAERPDGGGLCRHALRYGQQARHHEGKL